MKNKINKTISLILLLSILNGNILSMQEGKIEPNTQAMAIDQDVQQELSLLGLPAEVIEYILYQIIKPYENRIKDVNNIFEFYSYLTLLKEDLRGVVFSSKDLRLWTLDLINRLKKLKEKKYRELVNPIKAQYQNVSQDELNSKLRNILTRFIIKKNSLEEVAKLILSGANVNQKNNRGYTALTLATRASHKDIVQVLLVNGANVNEKDSYCYTALMYAAEHGHKDIVQLLISNGANVNEKNNYGDTVLMLAASNAHKDIIQLLIDNKANVNEKNNGEETALMYAAEHGHKDIVQLLIDNGANVNDRDNTGYTALTFAAYYGYKGIVQLLIDKGANVNEKNDYEETALMFAAKKGYKVIVLQLLLNGANVNVKDNNGDTALTLARAGHKGIAELLEAAKNKVNQNN